MSSKIEKDHSHLMDSIYGYQRHIYDISRSFFLIGRNALLKSMYIKSGFHVLEIGCGTGRNLTRLALRYPTINLYGLDASRKMLDTATRKLTQQQPVITLKWGLAENLTPSLFNRVDRFDVIFFSYSLSMIKDWRSAINAAINNLKKNGSLYIVDFADQALWPMTIQSLLKWYLGLFHVRFDPHIFQYLHTLEDKDHRKVKFHFIGCRYAYLACFGEYGEFQL